MNDRAEHARAWVKELLSESAILAVVQDGWPEAMAEAGFALHRQTWDVDAMLKVVESELDDVQRIPRTVAHLWPALPGAGVSPLLYSYLVGVPENIFKPSRRAEKFGQHAFLTAPDGVSRGDWEYADVVVVSGSNETVEAVRQRVTGRVIQYGHRVSFAIVDPTVDVHALARDTVMWHQQGCFSLRGVVFIGDQDSAERFCADLADAIAAVELLWAPTLTETRLAERAQALGSAEFEGRIWTARWGFVLLSAGPLVGHWRSPHAVHVVRVEDIQQVVLAVSIPRNQVQGVAVSKTDYANVAQTLGATRVCEPGLLQAPPADWPHDGLPNVSVLLR